MSIDVSDLVGIPFKNRGRDPKVALDCAGLAIQVFKRYGMNIPDANISAGDTEKFNEFVEYSKIHEDWEELNEPEDGCLILFRDLDGETSFVGHVGICIGNGDFIHTLKRYSSSMIDRLDNPFWKNMIIGYYRWVGGSNNSK